MDTLLRRSTGLFREEIRIKLRMILAASMNSDLPGLADTTLSGLKRGDSGALETVMGQYQHRLYRFLIRLTQDPAAAEDLFQQTWLRVIEKIGRYDAFPYCPSCGTTLANVCPSCRNAVEPGWSHCARCGAQLLIA